METSCTHPIYRLRNPQPIRNESGVIVGAEGPCRCGENWARAFFAGQAGHNRREHLRDVNEAGGSRLRGHGGPPSVSDMPNDTDSNRTASIKPGRDS